MKKIDFGLRTFTPIWSGDVNRNSATVRETGLLGSLRWWYEGIIRGMGGYACDPTADNACKYNPNKKQALDKLCPACLLFGCTGWQRRFKLELSGLTPIPLFFMASDGVYQMAGNWLWRMFGAHESGGIKSGRGRDLKLQFGVQTLWAEKAELSLIPFAPFDIAGGSLAGQLSFLLDTIARWGALGAKSQNGFGQISFSGLDKSQIAEGRRSLRKRIADLKELEQGQNKMTYFNLGSFFSRTYTLGDGRPYTDGGRLIGDPGEFAYNNFFLPFAFDLRYKNRSRNPFTGQGNDFGMRPWFKTRFRDEKITTLLFGKSQAHRDEERSAGRVGVSHLYKEKPDGPFLVKVWGHVPQNPKIDPSGVAEEIDAYLHNVFPSPTLIANYDPQEVLNL